MYIIALKSLSGTSEVAILNLKMLTTKGQSNLPKQRTLGPTWMALASPDFLQSQPRTQIKMVLGSFAPKVLETYHQSQGPDGP